MSPQEKILPAQNLSQELDRIIRAILLYSYGYPVDLSMYSDFYIHIAEKICLKNGLIGSLEDDRANGLRSVRFGALTQKGRYLLAALMRDVVYT